MNSHRQFTLCTLCLGFEEELLYAFDCNASDITLPVVIREVLQFEVSEGGTIPWMICTNCVEKLKEFREFKKQANKSMNFLQIMLVGRREHRNKTLEDGLAYKFTVCKENVSPGNLVDSEKDKRHTLDSHGVESEIAVEEDNGPFHEPGESVSPGNLFELVKDEPGSLDSHCVESEIALEEDCGHPDEPEENASPGNAVESVKDERDSLGAHGVESEITPEEDDAHFDEPEENVSRGNLVESVKDEPCNLDSHGNECEMHVKNQKEQEIPPAEEYLSTSGEINSFEGVQFSDALGSIPEQVPMSEELMDQDDLHLYLSSDSGDETSDAEDHSANITGPETEVTNVSFGDVTRVTVFGGGESVGNREETLEGEKDLKGLKDSERRFSARLRHGAKVPVATRSPLKQRRMRSHCRNENYGPDEDIESTLSSTSGKLFCKENGEHIKRKEEKRRESKHSNGALAGNISIGSSVGDEKSEGKDFLCDECGKVFRSKDLIERHLNVPCGSEVIDCGNSHKKFHTRKQHKRHRSVHCVSNVSKRREQRGVAVDVSGESEGNRQIEKRNPLTCHICKKNFSHRGYLNVHIKTVHLKERKVSCRICGEAFGRNGTLQTHMRYHNGVKPYTCSHCEKGFTESGNLRQHIRAVHDMEKPHTCGECGKAFSHKPHLKIHMLVHTGEKPHTCSICSRSFSHKHCLESHMLIHTGEKPHTCTLCSKTFRHNNSLKRHMATHARKVPHP